MCFVGIDISKFKHDCPVIDELSNTITPSWSFSNDQEGFSQEAAGQSRRRKKDRA